MRTSRLLTSLVPAIALAFGLCAAAPASAETATAPAAVQKAVKKERRTPVIVEFEGNDSIGTMLFSTLRSELESTNPASPAGEAKFRILLSTAAEFPSRPGVGSIYAVVWTLALSEGSMEYYLVRDLGVVTPDTVDDVVARIISRTDGVAARYGYLDRAK